MRNSFILGVLDLFTARSYAFMRMEIKCGNFPRNDKGWLPQLSKVDEPLERAPWWCHRHTSRFFKLTTSHWFSKPAPFKISRPFQNSRELTADSCLAHSKFMRFWQPIFTDLTSWPAGPVIVKHSPAPPRLYVFLTSHALQINKDFFLIWW